MANPSVPTIVNQNVSISDPNTPANQVKVNADGSLNTTAVAGFNPSVGTTGAAVPGSGTFIAANQSGNLVGLSLDASGNLKTAATITPPDMLNKTGSQAAAAVLFTQADCTGYSSVSAQITSVGSGNTIVAELSNDGTTWVVVNDQLSNAASITTVGEFVYLCAAKQFRMRVSVYSSGTVAVNANLRGYVYQQNTNATQAGAWTVTTTPPANASTNVTQFGGNAVATGTGASGVGIPRVTISNDSSLAANQSVNLAQVAGATTSTSASGVQRVGIAGNANATLDATLAAGTAPTNGVGVLGQFNTTLPTLTNGQTGTVQAETDGSVRAFSVLWNFAAQDALANNLAGAPLSNGVHVGGATFACPVVLQHSFNGASWDRVRTAGIGNNVAATGITAAASYGEYLSNANQPALTTGNYGSLQFTPDGAVRTAPQRPATGDILSGYQTFTSTTAATTLITIPQGRTWVGVISASCSCAEVAAGTAQPQARAVFTTAGTSVTPAAGAYFAVDARNGANAATGLVGSGASNFGSTPFTITAPAGNSVTIQVASTNVGTASVVDASAIGNLQ